MQFRVPQFIDIEDKLFGPFTFKQFLYLVGGGGLSYAIYKLLGIWIALVVCPPILGLALALTFVKVNNKPFVYILQAWLSYNFGKYVGGNALYIWKKAPPKKKVDKKEDAPITTAVLPQLSESKLRDIAWGLDVMDVEKK